MQLTFILTCFAKYDFLVDFFVVTNQANYQDYWGVYILGDPGAVSRVDKMSVVKVYCKIETPFGALPRADYCDNSAER